MSDDDDSFASANSTLSYLSADDDLTLGQVLSKDFAPHSKQLNVCHINAQSIPAHYSELLDTFSSGTSHAILVSESWLKPTLPSTSYCLPGYILVRNDREGCRGGGVAIYLKSNILYKVLAHSQARNAPAEYLLLELNLGCKVLLGVVYCPPTNDYFSSLESVLEIHVSNYSHHLVMGDFNTDLLVSDSRSRKLLSIVDSVNLKVLPLMATHHSNTSDTLIDLILSSDDSLIATHGQHLAPGFSRHDLIFCSYKIRIPKAKPVVLLQRSFAKMDVEKLKHDASLIQWSDMQDLPSVDDKVAFLCSNILHIFDKHAPVRPVKLKHRPTPWLTDTVRKAMAHRDRLFRRFKRHRTDENWSVCKAARNRCNKLCRNAKRRYILEQIELSSPSGIWKFLRTLGVGKPPSQDVQIPFDINDLNLHFTSVPSLDPLTKSVTLNIIKNTIIPTPDIDSFEFSPASRDEIKKIILSLKSKAVGHDNIGRIMVTTLLDILLPAITHIVNHSLSTGQFPNLWLKAYVLPLPKVPAPSAPNEYRPISILPFLSKVLESVVHRQMTAFLTKGRLLNRFQSGFRSGHSTTTALLKVTEDIRCAMEDRRVTVLVLVDFSNAFNAVDHDLLLAALECHKISVPAVSWFSSYLRGRQQAIRNGPSVVSDWADLTAGVPQGGILSPLLFSTFINFVTCNLHCSYHLYADDLQIYSHAKIDDLDAGIAAVNGDLAEILRWSQYFGISVNPKKCQSIIVGSSRLLSCLDYTTVPPVQFDGRVIPFSPTVNDLGLIIDEHLSWEQQLDKVSRKNGNHDQSRLATRHGDERVDALNMLAILLPGVTLTYQPPLVMYLSTINNELYILLPGVTLTYQGEELGMTDGYISWEETVDPQACNTDDPVNGLAKSRDPCRTPFHWDASANAGFSTAATTWLPVASNYATVNVAVEMSATKSHYHFYRDVVSASKTPAVREGDLETRAISIDVLAIARLLPGEQAIVGLVNLSSDSQTVDLSSFRTLPYYLDIVTVGVASTQTKGTRVTKKAVTISPQTAIVLQSVARVPRLP
ncbi:unnamed protein product [Plutella xylostella]|uniref:(diamondback moth) hypothetical protein n=1 Tax=Plutella xylostella TaxID=51655 RepID=A0A8S4FVW8_PLUXY|nr:unnamed protein product [Plutella xylostella]